MEKFLKRIIFLTILVENYVMIFSYDAPPKTLRNIDILYSSPFEISPQKPIITSNNVFFLSN